MTQQAGSKEETTAAEQTKFRLEKVHELEQHGASAPSLGSIISWGLKNIVIGEADLRNLLNNHNLEQVKIPDIRKRKALNRALKEMVDDELIRLVTDNKERITYVLIKMTNDVELEEVLFAQKLKVTYRKDAKPGEDALTFSSTAAESILRPLIDKYQTSYVSGDISRFILLVAIKRCGGIPLRPEGGMYFVPALHRGVVLDLRTFMEGLVEQQRQGSAQQQQEALAYLSMFNVLDDANAQKDMQRHAHDALKTELRDLTYLLGKMTSNPNRVVRAATIEKYLKDAERVGQEAALYHDLIKLEAEDIGQGLEKLRREFSALTQGDPGFGNEESASDDTQQHPSQTPTHTPPKESKFAPPTSDEAGF